MVRDAVDQHSSRPLLTLGRVDVVRVQVGYRARPDGPVHQQFLLDLPVPEPGSTGGPVDEAPVLAALEPALQAGDGAPRHYSLHTHRSHTSWGASPGALEVGLLVTAGSAAVASADVWVGGATRAFRDLMELTGRPEPTTTSRDAALKRARDGVAASYGLDPDTLSPSTEEHHAAENSWTLALRAGGGERYDVEVGLVDGYAGSVRIVHRGRVEVSDSVGSE
jgi:hypothetical protein